MTVESFEAGRNRDRAERAIRARRWQPVGREDHAALAQKLEARRERDDLCICSESGEDSPVPSWLCPVTWCWSNAAGAPCEERGAGYPGDCMVKAWPCVLQIYGLTDFTPHRMHARMRPMDRKHCVVNGYETSYVWTNVPPGGYYGPGFCPRRAGATLTPAAVKHAEENRYQCAHRLAEQGPRFGLPISSQRL